MKSKEKYHKAFKKYGVNPKSLGWKNKEAQDLRFKELLKDLDLEGKSILDFGCGLGDIVPYILDKTNDFEYTDVDNVPDFIHAVKELYKTRSGLSKKIGVNFLLRDFLKNPLRRKFDIVLCSGALNSNVADAFGYRKKAIKTLWQHAGIVLAFNMAGGFPQPENKKTNRVYYVDSLKMLSFCFTLSSKVIFRHQYRKRDFTIVLFR